MMNIQTIILLFVALIVDVQGQRRPTRSTSTTELVISRLAYGTYTPEISERVERFKDRKTKFVFEGVDYDLMPPQMYEKNHDCRTDFITCIRYRTVISPVCGWNSITFYFHDYHTPCEIEMINCYFTTSEGYGKYGATYIDNKIYYNGEGKRCIYYARMGGNMIDAYFGNVRRRSANINNYYKAIRNLPYHFNATKE